MSIGALNVNAHHDYQCDCRSDGGDRTCYQPDSGDYKVNIKAGGIANLNFYCGDSSLHPGSVDYHIKNNAISCSVTECSENKHQIQCENFGTASHHVDVEHYECMTGTPEGHCNQYERRFLFEEDKGGNATSAVEVIEVVILIILMDIGSIMIVLCLHRVVKEEAESILSTPTTNIV